MDLQHGAATKRSGHTSTPPYSFLHSFAINYSCSNHVTFLHRRMPEIFLEGGEVENFSIGDSK